MGFEVQRAVTIRPSRARRETRDGRPHVVAPVTLCSEGVLNGALVPFQALDASAPGWNGQPITADHPQVDGTYVSANRGDTADQHIGVVQNVTTDSVTQTLNGEAWIDEQKAYARGGQAAGIARTIAAFADDTGENHADLGFHDDHTPTPLGVSVGYHFNKQEVAGEYGQNREPYTEVHTGLLPDHLGIFLEDKGACSLRDGCGIPAQKGQIAVNVRDTARTPDYSGTTSGEWSAPSLSDYLTGYSGLPSEASDVDDLSSDDKTLIASKTLLGESGADSMSDLVFFPVVEPSSDNLNENALDAVISGRGAQADISQDTLESARSVAYNLLEDEFDRDLQSNAASDGQDTSIEVLADGGVDGSSQGDRVRWSSKGSGNQYGIVVDDLGGDDGGEPDKVLVAVYEPNQDDNKWKATDTTRRLTIGSLTGLGRFPPLSSVASNAQHDHDDCDCGGGDGDSCTCADSGTDTETSRAGFLASMAQVWDRYIGGSSGEDGSPQPSSEVDTGQEPETEPDEETQMGTNAADDSGTDPASDSDTDNETTMEVSQLAEQSAFSTDELEDDDELRKKVAQTITGTEDGGDGAGDDSGTESGGGDSTGGLEQKVEQLTEQVEALATQSQKSERASVVEFLAAHTEHDPEDLEDKDTDTLRAMKAGVESTVGMSVNTQRRGVNYAGRGIPSSGGSDDEDGYVMETPFAAAAKANREGGD